MSRAGDRDEGRRGALDRDEGRRAALDRDEGRRGALDRDEGRRGALDRDTLVQAGLATATLRGRTAVRSWLGRVVSGPDAGREIAVGSRPAVVGAHRSCDLVLTDPKISSRHAELVVERGGVRVRDLGSTNGTRLHGSQITEAVVAAGAAVELGDTVLRLVAAEVPSVAPSGRHAFGGLVGKSLAMREVFAVLELASPSDATILIQGESGTGKEVAARAIHDHSRRASGPFVVVDGGALTAELAHSQLFGHKRGAFTGAVADRKGAFVDANGGTLFLDEIGELPAPVQASLLRALEQRAVVPLGGDRPVPVDVRIVAATHRDLAGMVEQKAFRFDLFHRIAVVHVAMPPLRDRLEDVPEIVTSLCRARGVAAPNAARVGEPASTVEGDNLEVLRRHAWPGNVRELRNALDRAWALSGAPDTPFAELRLTVGATAPPAAREAADAHLPFKEAKERCVDRFERRYLAAVIARFDGNITRAADHAGINRRHFRELLDKHGLYERPD